MFLKDAPERELATAMARYWVEFAATGQPAQGGAGSDAPVWPSYGNGSESVMQLGHQKVGG